MEWNDNDASRPYFIRLGLNHPDLVTKYLTRCIDFLVPFLQGRHRCAEDASRKEKGWEGREKLWKNENEFYSNFILFFRYQRASTAQWLTPFEQCLRSFFGTQGSTG